MNVSFYTAAVGANQQQQRLNVHANNIANINTYGFKAEKPTFSSLMYRNLQGMNGQELPRGSGSRMIMADTDFSDGALVESGHTLDYAIIGDGFFGLYDPTTEEISYTRKGSFALSGFQRPNEEGVMESVYMLSDGYGRFVLNKDGKPLEVKEDSDPGNLPIAVYGFDHTNGMRPVGTNRYLPVDKNGTPRILENSTLQQGFMEASNSDLATELTKVIESQRSYSYALKMVQTSDEIENTINGLRG